MANENNNINELVADDDDPTAEFAVPSFAPDEFDAEADAKTYDPEQHGDRGQSTEFTVSKLESDLRSREKIIGRLRSDIRQRDENYRQLKHRLDDLLLTASDTTSSPENEMDSAIESDNKQTTNDLNVRIRQSEEYADAIRQQSHDLIEKNTRAEREIASLSNRLTEATGQNALVTKDISSATSEVAELQSTLKMIQSQHEEEIRILRFELGSAQSTIVQADEMNSQVVSDLIDAQSFKDGLEQMLGDAEEQSSRRIEQLEKEVTKLTLKADGFEQKLTAKSEAISVLLAELAKNSERIESVGEIEEVIQDIDDRMSVRSVSTDRVSRVLVGTVDDQKLRFPLFKNRLTIGRTRNNDIQLKAVYVSRRHAVIQTDGDVTRIIDRGSKNGIQVNSANVSEHFLCHGDTIVIGNARFRYEERKKRDSR
jgi:hypothetical protein